MNWFPLLFISLLTVGCSTPSKYKTIAESYPGRDAVKFIVSCRDLESANPTIYLEARNDTLYRHDIELAHFTLVADSGPIKPTGWIWRFREVYETFEGQIRRSYPGARVPANTTIIIRMNFPTLEDKDYRLTYNATGPERTLAECRR